MGSCWGFYAPWSADIAWEGQSLLTPRWGCGLQEGKEVGANCLCLLLTGPVHESYTSDSPGIGYLGGSSGRISVDLRMVFRLPLPQTDLSQGPELFLGEDFGRYTLLVIQHLNRGR